MTEQNERRRFIPFRRADVVTLLAGEGRLDGQRTEQFRELARLVAALYHFTFHDKLEALKQAYFPFDPDTDVQPIEPASAEQREACAERLRELLREVLNHANFEPVPREQIEACLEQQSPLRLKLQIDFTDFAQCDVFTRGETVKQREVRRWFLFRRVVEVPTFERVALFIRFRDAQHFAPRRLRRLPFEPGSTIVKLFKDIPRSDLEMLFPNTELRMRGTDIALIGVPAIGGAVPILTTKVFPFLGAITGVVLVLLSGKPLRQGEHLRALLQAALGLGVLGGYILRQWSKFKNRRILFLKTLSDNLYFRNLDNNAGVFSHLIDAAEEEECKEAILAYYFLLTRGPQRERALDEAVERWFEETTGARIDFEVDDALRKLEQLGIGAQQDGVWRVVEPAAALAALDRTWDELFGYNV